MSRRAVILAGGKGTRLHPYTVVLPKPLMPLGQYPILEVIIRQLVNAGFDHITLAVNHYAEIIEAFFQNGDRWNVRIDYSMENQPLGTMGPLKLIDDLPEHFLVMNGDILCNLNYAKFHDKHVNQDPIFTISSHVREELIDYGVLSESNGFLIGLSEKPRMSYVVSMGVYMMSRQALEFIPKNSAYGFDELMNSLVDEGKTVAVHKFDGYWLDIGRPDDYASAINIFESDEAKFLPNF